MGVIRDRDHGPDFRQSDKPTDVNQGLLWYNSGNDKYRMADGVDYWGSVESATKGLVFGSYPSTAANVLINEITFADGTFVAGPQNLTKNRLEPTGLDSLEYGYAMFGGPSGNTDADRISFSTGAVSLVTTTTAPAGINGGAGCEDASSGYVLGGNDLVTPISGIHKLAFASESISKLSSVALSQSKESIGPIQTNTVAFAFGGRAWNGSTLFTTGLIEEFEFSSETILTTYGSLQNVQSAVGLSSGYGVGYVCGGAFDVTPYHGAVQEFTYASKALAWGSGMSRGIGLGASVQSLSEGFICGGQNVPGPNGTNLVEHCNLATGVFSNYANQLTAAFGSTDGCQNINGYYG